LIKDISVLEIDTEQFIENWKAKYSHIKKVIAVGTNKLIKELEYTGL
jgi:hypothetical protein